MLSLRELRRAARILGERYTGATLRRIVQPDEQKLVLVFEQPAGKAMIMISGKPDFARICTTERADPADAAGSFHEYARAHLPGTSLAAVEVPGTDRQLEIRLERGDARFTLILSILGSRSNVYLLNGEKRLLHAMKSLEDTRRELKIGDLWTYPQGSAPEGEDRWSDISDENYLDNVGQFYADMERRVEAEHLIRKIEQAIRKERAFLDRKAVNLQEDLGEAKKAEAYRKSGELLKNVLHTVRQGDAFAKATDYETGELISIPLDTKLTPAANLESYFSRYQKESRGLKMIEQQILDLEILRSELDTIASSLESASRGANPDIEALKALAAQPKVHRLIQHYSPKRKPAVPVTKVSRKREVPSRLLPKRYVTQEGLEIWVGKNDEGNDYLTTRLARGNDLFFHLEGYPGSHVVLRTEGRPDPPQKSLLDACELAVHFSKMKNAGSADVHVAHIKDVKKPKGAKPGLVYVRSGKTIRLKRDQKRLQSILASRIEA